MPSARTDTAPAVVTAGAARRMLLGAQGLLADPTRKATPAAVYRQIERMGYLQVDTINIVERAHHHIMMTRFDGYRPATLHRLLERDRRLFEHWTHDAAVIPTVWHPYWRHRFERYHHAAVPEGSWWRERMGENADTVVDHVLDRIRDEGPLMSRDFEHDRRPGDGAWWGWKPQKAALEYLWRAGTLSISQRVNFHKVYDLTERVLPEQVDVEPPGPDAHRDWACREALARLGAATPAEIAAFFAAIKLEAARDWCREKLATGEIVEVVVESEDGGKPKRSVALPDWRRRAARCPDPPERMRLLSPFDPVIRDRKRAERLFDFEYRFEAFVPEPKRRYGYYVMPVLEGDRLVGRIDPKLHRDRGVLAARGPWWEPGVKPTKRRQAKLEAALGRFAETLGAERFEITPA